MIEINEIMISTARKPTTLVVGGIAVDSMLVKLIFTNIQLFLKKYNIL